jgi:hypothetical protein
MRLQYCGNAVVIAGCFLAAGMQSQAGSATYKFDTDPSSVLKLFGTSTWVPSDGNPSTGGYLSITDALNSQRGAIVFDDFDNGLVVKGFSFSMDVRVGGGTDSPADGISINYVRAGDPRADRSAERLGHRTERESNLPRRAPPPDSRSDRCVVQRWG